MSAPLQQPRSGAISCSEPLQKNSSARAIAARDRNLSPCFPCQQSRLKCSKGPIPCERCVNKQKPNECVPGRQNSRLSMSTQKELQFVFEADQSTVGKQQCLERGCAPIESPLSIDYLKATSESEIPLHGDNASSSWLGEVMYTSSIARNSDDPDHRTDNYPGQVAAPGHSVSFDAVIVPPPEPVSSQDYVVHQERQQDRDLANTSSTRFYQTFTFEGNGATHNQVLSNEAPSNPFPFAHASVIQVDSTQQLGDYTYMQNPLGEHILVGQSSNTASTGATGASDDTYTLPSNSAESQVYRAHKDMLTFLLNLDSLCPNPQSWRNFQDEDVVSQMLKS